MDNTLPLIPKIDLKDNAEVASILAPNAGNSTDVQNPPQEAVPQNASPAIKKRFNVKILWGILGGLLFVTIYFVVAGFLIYQKGTKLAGSVKKLQAEAGMQDLKIIASGVDRVRTEL